MLARIRVFNCNGIILASVYCYYCTVNAYGCLPVLAWFWFLSGYYCYCCTVI